MANVLGAFDGYFNLSQNQTSEQISVGHVKNCSIQVIVDNQDAAGTLRVQASNNRSDWTNVWWRKDGYMDNHYYDGYSVTSGKDINHIFNFSNLSVGWLRLNYTRTSGSGGLSFYVHTNK